MSQVILIEPDKTLNELLSINLSTYVGVELIPRENAADAINLLNILPSVDLIITRDVVGDEKTAKTLIEFLENNHAETGLIILGEIPKGDEEKAIGIDNPKNWEMVINAAAKILGVNPENLANKVLPDYIPIPVSYFVTLETSCCDVFIRIKKGPDDYQYVKRIHQGDMYSPSMVKRYVEQGLDSFYIPKEFQVNFTNFVSDQLVKKLENVQDEEIEKQIEVISASYEIATKEILSMGFNSATIQLTETIVNSMVKTFENSPEMSPLLHKVINSKASYMYQHCHMTSVVASEIVNNLGLNDQLTHQKFAYAAFFSDISLVDDEELSKITTYEELEAAELTEQDWDLVFNHALEASILIRKNPEAPADIDEIIKHHHGAMNGKGFSITNASKLSGLSKIFFISCEFVKQILNFKEQGGKPVPIIEDLYKRYPDKEMVKVVKALEQTLMNKNKKPTKNSKKKKKS